MRGHKKGYKHSEDTKIKIGLSHLGKNYFDKEEIERRKIKMMGNKYRLGMKHTNETKIKMSNSHKKKQLTLEHLENLSKANKLRSKLHYGYVPKGRKLSEELKNKLSLMRLKDKNPAWLGGKSFEPYSLDFDDIFKKAIRNRDNYTCLLCNSKEEELDRLLSVHHINYDKSLSIKENCCSLCSKCHALTNINRKQWAIFFQELLNMRYNYNYHDNKIMVNLT